MRGLPSLFFLQGTPIHALVQQTRLGWHGFFGLLFGQPLYQSKDKFRQETCHSTAAVQASRYCRLTCPGSPIVVASVGLGLLGLRKELRLLPGLCQPPGAHGDQTARMWEEKCSFLFFLRSAPRRSLCLCTVPSMPATGVPC